MSALQLKWIPYVLSIMAVCAVVYGYEQTTHSTNQLCKHEYALCTSALCIPQPDDPAKAACICDVQQGVSMASVPCSTLQPSTDANGIRTVYSSFSFEQFKQGKKGMRCPSGSPWTWCLNKRCTVDPSDAKRALCVCDVLRTGEWMTLGGNCDTSTCATGYWSGATLQDVNESSVFMVKALGLETSPVKWCQAVE